MNKKRKQSISRKILNAVRRATDRDTDTASMVLNHATMKPFKVLLSLVLCAVLLSQSLYVSASSGGLTVAPNKSSEPAVEETVETASDVDSLKTAVVLYELTANRTAHTKEYVLSNGLHMAVTYPDQVHFEKNGEWTDIDNTLTLADDTYTNTDAPHKVFLPATINSSESVSVEADGHVVSFRLTGASDGDRSVKSVNGSHARIIEKEPQLKDGKIHPEYAPDGLTSRLAYERVFSGTDLVYDVTPYGLKESVVIDSLSDASKTYSFELCATDLIPVLLETGEVKLCEKDTGDVVFTLPSPFLYDAEYACSTDVKVTLEQKDETGLYELTYTLPLSWLSSPERAFPVVLDPAIQTEQVRTNIRDKAVYQTYNASDTLGVIEVGKNPGFGLCRSYVKYVNLPAITSSDVIVKAELWLYHASNTYSGNPTDTIPYPIEVHEVGATWETPTLLWSTQPSFDWTVSDTTNQRTNWFYRLEITDIARGWYSGENTGLLLTLPQSVENDPTVSSYRKQFWSADYSRYQTMQKPTAIIYFRNNNGLEGYWNYDGADAGRAGTGFVNTYTGNLVFTRDDLGFSGSRMPVSITHVYNLNDVITPNDSNNSNDSGGNTFHLGYGWRTNYNQLLYQWTVTDPYTTIPAGTHYIWEDADGTDHYFVSDNGTYKDEDGLNLTLTTNGTGDTTYCITDEKGNETFFDSYGRLTKLSNNQETKSFVTITYNGTTKEINTVTDGAGRRYVFTYSNDLLTNVTYYGTGTTALTYVNYSYTDGNLTSVTDKDNKTIFYTYDANRLLTSASDVDGYKLTYTYNTVNETYQPYRVLSVEESDESGSTPVLGGLKTYDYRHNETVVTDHNGTSLFLQFNDFGNLTCVKDEEGNASFSRYAFHTDTQKDNNTDATKKGNQLRASSDLQYTVMNLMKGHSMENALSYWSAVGNASFQRNANVSYADRYSLEVVSPGEGSGVMSVAYTVPANSTETFSCYVLPSSAPVYLKASSGNDSVTSESVSSGNTWKRLQVSFTNDTNASRTVYYSILSGDDGTFYADSAQLELSSVANRYNLIEDGDFTYGNSFTGSNGIVETLSEGGAPQLDGNVLKIVGDYVNDRSYSQTIPVSGVTGDYYTVAGWAKACSLPIYGDDRTFAVRGQFHYTDNTWSDPFIASFNPGSREWQYAATGMIAEKAYSEVKVTIAYDHNANTAFFDGVQLYKDGFGYKYEYDDDNHVISVLSSSGEEDEYEYTDNDLTREIIHTGAELEYTYDQYHNVTAATKTENGQTITYQFGYDTYGNNTSVSITDGTTTMSTSAAYTSDGNRLSSATDAKGNVTVYQYDADTNLLLWVQYPEDTDGTNGTTDTRTYYDYDAMYRLVSSSLETDLSQSMSVGYTYDNQDRLTQVSSPSTDYDFTYGDFSMRTSVSIGNRSLSAYSYTNDRNHYLSRLTYGNGDFVSYTRDSKGRVTLETFEDNETVEYFYDNDGSLASVIDSGSGTTTKQNYDFMGRVSSYEKTNPDVSMTFSFEYEENTSRLAKVLDAYDGYERGVAYTYDNAKRLTGFLHGKQGRNYSYDAFDRVSAYETTYKADENASETTVLTTTVGFSSPSAGTTSNQVASIHQQSSGVNETFTYTYDGNGNVLSVSDGTYVTTYVYDSANQLIRENNEEGNFTHAWTYDDAGNILTRKEYTYTTGNLQNVTPTNTVNYSYGDQYWGDLLTSYDGHTITYDAIGNPLSDGTRTYTWQHGRELSSISDGTTTWSFTYGADGYRTKKTNGTTTYAYGYEGGLLRYMEVNGTTKWYFTYAPDGTPIGFELSGTQYYYETNLQGDVIGILTSAGVRTVRYAYDAWGNLLSTTGTDASTIGVANPIRYRGYVYDQETGLYYLTSRYYNPEIGRFVNLDLLGNLLSVLGFNLFIYCLNDPIVLVDLSGFYPVCITDLDPVGDESIKSIRDVTEEVDKALFRQASVYQRTVEIVRYLERNHYVDSQALAGMHIAFLIDFAMTVMDKGDWDIKHIKPWIKTIQTVYPGDGATVKYHGKLFTLEELGNFTYGVLGKAYGFSDSELLIGSGVNAFFKGTSTENELVDQKYISLGIAVYNKIYCKRKNGRGANR